MRHRVKASTTPPGSALANRSCRSAANTRLQTAPDAVHALVVPGRTWSDHAHARTLDRMRKRVGDGMRVELQMVREIATTAAGKFQTVVPLSGGREAVVLAVKSSRPAPEALPRRKTA
jgi:hypothetical protein